MGNKQRELETMVPLENFDLIAIKGIWWEDSHDWNTTIEGYKLFRRDRQGRRGRKVTIFVRKQIDWGILVLRNSQEKAENVC